MPDDPQSKKKAAPSESDHHYAEMVKKHMCDTKTCGNRWFVYELGAWRERSRHKFKPKTLEVLPIEHRTSKRGRAILDLLEDQWQVDFEKFNGAYLLRPATASTPETVVLNLLNGVLFVTSRDIQFTKHDPELYFTRTINVDYKATATCPLYDQTMVEALPDEADRRLFRLCLGNFLLPHARFETALVCYGDTGCSKSTLADPIASIFGDGGLLTRLSMSQICNPDSFSLSRLNYACVNLGTELQSLAVEESGNYKAIISDEDIDVRPIYCAPFTMKPKVKLMFLSNDLPRFKHGTAAEQRRTQFIHFNQRPKVKDGMLKDKLNTELQGIFNLMLKALQELLVLPEMPLGSAQSQAVVKRFRDSNDPVGTFVQDRCILGSEYAVGKADLAAAYHSYLIDLDGCEKLNATFFRRLYERFPNVRSTRLRVDGERVYRIEGIMLKPEYVDPNAGILGAVPGCTSAVPPSVLVATD